MKINSKQLPQYLQQQLAPIYLISGNEPLLVQEACDAVRAATEKAGYLEKQRFYVEANFDWNYLVNQINTLSLFNDKRFVEICLENIKLTESGNKTLQNIASAPPMDVIILIKTAKLAANVQSAAWYKAIEKTAICLTIWPLNQHELRTWIKQRLQSAQLETTADAIELIASSCEGNLLAAKQTIEKLQLSYTCGSLSYDDVIAAITDHSHFSIFDLTDAILAGKAQQIVKIISGLKGEGIEPILVLWAITKELRQIIKIAFEQQHNAIDAVLRRYYIREQQKPLIKRCLQRHHMQTLNLFLQQSLKIDQAIKGIKRDNIWDQLEQLSLAIGGTDIIKPRSLSF